MDVLHRMGELNAESQLLGRWWTLMSVACTAAEGELRADAESGVGVDPEAHAHSAVKYDSEAGWVARSESGSESELRKSDSVRAQKRVR